MSPPHGIVARLPVHACGADFQHAIAIECRQLGTFVLEERDVLPSPIAHKAFKTLNVKFRSLALVEFVHPEAVKPRSGLSVNNHLPLQALPERPAWANTIIFVAGPFTFAPERIRVVAGINGEGFAERTGAAGNVIRCYPKLRRAPSQARSRANRWRLKRCIPFGHLSLGRPLVSGNRQHWAREHSGREEQSYEDKHGREPRDKPSPTGYKGLWHVAGLMLVYKGLHLQRRGAVLHARPR